MQTIELFVGPGSPRPKHPIIGLMTVNMERAGAPIEDLDPFEAIEVAG